MSSKAERPVPPLSDLLRRPATALKDEGDRTPRVVRYDLPDGPVVLKSWRPGAGPLKRWWARRVMAREVAHYRRLDGARGIPRLRAVFDGDILLIDHVDGLPIRRDLDPARLHPGLDDLESVLAGLHARRFAHLDLHQRKNVLVDAGGRAWVVDLAGGLDCSRGLVRRALFPLLARIDRRAALKFRARYAPATLPAGQREALVARHGTRRTRRALNAIRRAVDRVFVRDG